MRLRFLPLLLVAAHPCVVAGQGFPDCGMSPKEPLPTHDWSKSGYQNGAALPVRPATLTFPAGRDTIRKQILLKSGDILRGAGRDKTILYFPGGLKQMGLPCRNGKIITATGPGTGDCYDWESQADSLIMGVIGARGSEIGIEDLTIEFPAQHEWTHYGNHLHTSGYNGIEFKRGSANCWVRNVAILNADNGVMVSYSSNITLEGLEVRMRSGGGHNHVAYNGSKHIVTNNFTMYGTSSHGLTVNQGGDNEVFSNGWMENGRLEPDHSCGQDTSSARCTRNLLVSNLSGKIGSIQTLDRTGAPIASRWVRWNVGSVNRCPLDAYSSQIAGSTGIRSAKGSRPERFPARNGARIYSIDGTRILAPAGLDSPGSRGYFWRPDAGHD